MPKKALIGLGLGLIFLASGCSALQLDSSDETTPARTSPAAGEGVSNQVESSVQILPAEAE